MIKKPDLIYDSLGDLLSEADPPEKQNTPPPTNQPTNTDTGNLDTMGANGLDSTGMDNLGGMGGMGGTDMGFPQGPDYTLTDLGKIYALKKINSAINGLKTYIDDEISKEPSKQLVSVQKQLSDLEDMFVMVSSNLDKYVKDKLEKIIDLMEHYIKSVSQELSVLSEKKEEQKK